MNSTEIYLQDLTLLSRASLVGVTHEGVASLYIERLWVTRVLGVLTWRHVGPSRAKLFDVTESCRLLCRD
jgi:hypothetical protein